MVLTNIYSFIDESNLSNSTNTGARTDPNFPQPQRRVREMGEKDMPFDFHASVWRWFLLFIQSTFW